MDPMAPSAASTTPTTTRAPWAECCARARAPGARSWATPSPPAAKGKRARAAATEGTLPTSRLARAPRPPAASGFCRQRAPPRCACDVYLSNWHVLHGLPDLQSLRPLPACHVFTKLYRKFRVLMTPLACLVHCVAEACVLPCR